LDTALIKPSVLGRAKMKTLTMLVSLGLASLTATATQAATMWRDKTAIFIRGTIVPDDFEQFKQVVNRGGGVPRGFPVVMKSTGGALIAGLEIGIVIRKLQLKTVVVDECYSVCAFMWLAGVKRFAFSDSEIGFHGAYDSETKAATSSGNALLGAYLARLGFSYEIIGLMTSAAHDDISLLNYATATKYGVAMTVLPTQKKAAAATSPASGAVPYVKDVWCPTCAPGAQNLPR
jgi:hypothetical protein